MNRLAGVLVAISSFSAPVLWAQQPQAPEQTGTVIRSDVREVLVDFVVRNSKNAQMAKKLKASDITVLEDGVPQTLRAFRFVGGEAAIAPTDQQSQQAAGSLKTPLARPGAPSTAAGAKRVEDPTYVSVVFEDLSPNTRKYALGAVVEFVNRNLGPDTYIAVFHTGSRLIRLQNFTKDRALVVDAAHTASAGETGLLAQTLANPLNQFNYSVVGSTGGVTVTPSVDQFTTTVMSTAGAASPGPDGQLTALAESQQVPLLMYQLGMRTVDALLKLVEYESHLPGRKAVIYLCEGLTLPPGMRERIDGVISNANRARVSFYGIDVSGLTSSDPDSFAQITDKGLAATSKRQRNWSNTGADESMAKQDDSQFLMGVANRQENMQELSERTGGFAVMNTNEIGKNMLRVVEDVRSHYELTYVPTSQVYDGHFRKIEVRVTNPKLTVQSRDGYYALPELNGRTVETYELAALNALSSSAHPAAFPFRIAAYRFRPEPGGFRYEIAFDVPIDELSTKLDPAGKLARIHTTLVALIKDSKGEVVDKVSNDIDRMEPADKLEMFRRGEIIFTSAVSLAPGHYTVEGASIDAEGNRSSVRRIAIMVPQPDATGLSDLALVHDLQSLGNSRDPRDGLEFDGGRVTPELGGSTPSTQNAALYFVVYPDRSLAVAPHVQFLRDGAVVAEVQPTASQPDATNATPFIVSTKLPPGDYEARVTVQFGGHALQRSTVFTVAP
jgi:VWFA-related protein